MISVKTMWILLLVLLRKSVRFVINLLFTVFCSGRPVFPSTFWNFLFVFGFLQFECHVPKCRYFSVYPEWWFLSSLVPWFGVLWSWPQVFQVFLPCSRFLAFSGISVVHSIVLIIVIFTGACQHASPKMQLEPQTSFFADVLIPCSKELFENCPIVLG